jgi:hypothetical protein
MKPLDLLHAFANVPGKVGRLHQPIHSASLHPAPKLAAPGEIRRMRFHILRQDELVSAFS